MTIDAGHDGETGLTTSWQDGTLHIRGEVDAATCRLFNTAVLAHVVDGRIRIRMADCTFCDSSCLAVLADARRRGIIVTVVAPSPTVLRVLELTGLSQLLDLEP